MCVYIYIYRDIYIYIYIYNLEDIGFWSFYLSHFGAGSLFEGCLGTASACA